MERLTYDFPMKDRHCWQIRGANNLTCSEVCKGQGDNGCDGCPLERAFNRLAAYENTGLEPKEIDIEFIYEALDENRRLKSEMVGPRAVPNAPLTVEELREMDGEPVWVVPQDGRNESCWMLVDVEYELCREAHGGMAVFENNGNTWMAYRRKPEVKQ